MIITKKALPRRTFLKGAQAVLALPLLDAMIPAATAWAQTPAKPVPRLGFVYMPMGCDHSRWTPAGGATLTQLSPILRPLEPVKNQRHRHHQHPAAEFLSRHARHVELGVSERGLLEAYRELRLLSRHDDGPDCGQADGPRHAAAVARAGDGSESARRRMQQRIRLRLSELPVLVFADDAAALRSASAHRLRAPVRRGRQRGGAPRGTPQPGESARFVQQRHRAAEAARRHTGSRTCRSVSRQRSRDRAADPACRGRCDGQHDARPGSPGRRPCGVRRPREAHVRSADSCIPGGHHAGHHVPVHARAEQSHLSRDRGGRMRIIRRATTATIRKRSRRFRRSTRSMSRCSRSSSRG